MIVLYGFMLAFVTVFGNDLEGENSKQTRLLLHTDLDLAQQLTLLTSRLDAQQANLTSLTNTNNELFTKLNVQHEQIVNITNQLSIKDKEIQALKSTIDHQTGTGSTYTRWGRTTCPGNGTDLVYEGYMGGSSRDHPGGGTNYLCLSSNPQWDHYDETIVSFSTIVGVEYEFGAFIKQNGASQFFGKNIYNDDVPCAVCHTKRSTTLMIPGRTECYSGWTKEYSGYIATEYEKQTHQTEFICVDRRPDVVVGGKTNDDEGVIYFVEASCGKSLECPPYIQGRELACVVCSL